MSFKPFRKIRVPPNTQVDDKQINAVQDNISLALSPLLNKDQLDSSILTNVSLLPGIVNTVPHGLGRVLRGWMVVRNHAASIPISDMQDTGGSPKLLLYLTVPSACTVDLLVF